MTVLLTGIIILLILTLIIIAVIYNVFVKIQRKARRFSNLAWGTDSMEDGIKKMQQEYSQTPKSVSAMTSLYLPKITRDFPQFQYDEMKSRAENVLISYLLAIDAGVPEKLQEGNRELKSKLEMYIFMLKGKGQEEHYEKIKIHKTEISNYRKRDGRCIITFQAAVQYFWYVKDEEGVILDGSNNLYSQRKYDIDVIYIQDRNLVENELDLSLGINCPNCGAPVTGLGSKACEYCQTPIVELNIHAWTFSQVKEIR